MGVSSSPGVRRDAVTPPNWLPTPVRTYLAHTEAGTSIRALARKAGVHPSTVLRQVRRTEMLRDDPLADAALNRLGRFWNASQRPGRDKSNNQDPLLMTAQKDDDLRLARETLRVLRALLEPDTLLVIADGVEDAVVVPSTAIVGTDNRFLRPLGIPSYGFIPCLLSQAERDGFHANDEFLTVENLNLGLEVMFEVVRRFCAAPEGGRSKDGR